ncbi:hypothetical protein ABT115_15110 [Streptomyces sp. NPDC001832]|uniref:hypothetical protein n=1 Tax=Streptomyces sp. NPDC001832 TaxID=3154527 RepID=UPI0033306056
MTTTQTGATLAACAIAVAILGIQLRKWWTGGRAWKDLLHTVQGFVTGALGTACAGGILGWLAGCTRQVANGAGGKAVTGVTGTESSAPIATGSIGQLSEEGGAVVFLVAVILFVTYKAVGKDEKGKLLGAMAAGFILCATAGVAGALHGLPELVNSIGLSGRNILERNT